MSRIYKAWVDEIAHDLEPHAAYSQIIANVKERGGIFSGWEKLADPGRIRYLRYAIDIACIAWRHPYRTLFLDWAVQIADRALLDSRWDVTQEDIAATRHLRKRGDPAPRWWKQEGVYPGNHGETLRNAVLAHAMQDAADPDYAKLAQAGREIIEGVTQKKRHHWDYIEQSAVMRGVHLLLIAGEVAEAKKAISLKRRGFAWIQTTTTACATGRSRCPTRRRMSRPTPPGSHPFKPGSTNCATRATAPPVGATARAKSCSASTPCGGWNWPCSNTATSSANPMPGTGRK